MSSTAAGALPRLIRLTSRDVYRNLATEEVLFRHLPVGSALFYENTPSVLFGRTQNPFLELDIPYAARNAYTIARRRSGGGCVTHGPGNLNVCFVQPAENHSITNASTLLAATLKARFDIPAQANDRGDVILNDNNVKKKISGCAHRISRGKAYSHFTVLVDSDLAEFSRVLNSPARNFITGPGTKSMRSEIANISSYTSTASSISMDDVMHALANAIAPTVPLEEDFECLGDLDIGMDLEKEIAEEVRAISNAGWIYGKTPKFTYTVDVVGGRFEVLVGKAGVIDAVKAADGGNSINSTAVKTVARAANRALKGVAFDLDEIAPRMHDVTAKYGATPFEPPARQLTGRFLHDVPVLHWEGKVDVPEKDSTLFPVGYVG